jgi:hypothetical protein
VLELDVEGVYELFDFLLLVLDLEGLYELFELLLVLLLLFDEFLELDLVDELLVELLEFGFE